MSLLHILSLETTMIFLKKIDVWLTPWVVGNLKYNMETVYAILENGELYQELYSSYDAARAAVLHNHAETLEEQRSECAEWGGMMCSKVDVEENKETGATTLYIEKGIHITIQRYNVPK